MRIFTGIYQKEEMDGGKDNTHTYRCPAAVATNGSNFPKILDLNISSFIRNTEGDYQWIGLECSVKFFQSNKEQSTPDPPPPL